jgi:hypothetical protein
MTAVTFSANAAELEKSRAKAGVLLIEKTQDEMQVASGKR